MADHPYQSRQEFSQYSNDFEDSVEHRSHFNKNRRPAFDSLQSNQMLR